MIKLVNITEEARGGGPLNRIRQVAAYLQKEGLITEVLFPKHNSEDFQESLSKLNIPTQQISLTRLTREKYTLLWYVLSFIPQVIHLIYIIKREKYDLVLCNGSWQIKGIIAAKFTKAKSIWIQNDSQQASLVEKLFSLVSGWSDAFIFVAEKTKSYYASINPKILNKPYAIIQSPIDLDHFSPGDNNLFSQEYFNVLTVGYINPNKGLETLVEAVHLIKKTELKIRFYIAGPVFKSQEKYKENIEKLIKRYELDNIEFLGMRKDIVHLLHSADLYLCSSDFEASPIAVWEALSTGLPTLSTAVGDVKNIFDQSGCGIVIPTKDPKAMAEELIKLVSNPDLRFDLSQKARKTAQRHFSLGNTAHQYADFYQKVLKS